MIRTVYLIADEYPQAKQSVQFGKHGAFTPKKKRDYIKRLKQKFRDQYTGPVFIGNLRITILYAFPWPKSEVRMKSLGWQLTNKRTDLDNLTKPAVDSLTGILYTDDSQIVEIRARKIRFAEPLLALRVDEIAPNRNIFKNTSES